MILSLDRVSKTYVRNRRTVAALEEVSLEVGRGELVGIFGPSRAGKTTLLRIAAGLERPDSGTVTYQGQRLDEMSRAERTRYRRRDVGCVWRSPGLVPGLDVLDAVALRLLVDGHDRRDAERRAQAALAACGAEHCIDVAPWELSDLERRRVGIAQALVSDPGLLLADCPASELDSDEQDSILSMFRSLAREKGVAILIADSDANSVLAARPLLYLRAGRVVNSDAAVRRASVTDLASARNARAR
jgi:putative ABC transport system ATP-binding protein